MRLSVAALGAVPTLVVGMLAAMPAAAQRSFPYKAYVTGKDVYVRSGPGEQYYPTEKLQAGAAVEVYRRDPGGWLAIRPLPESYSWVSGRFLKPGQDGLAAVTADRVAVRVGSQFSDIREVVQVRLDRGEAVEVKGTKQIAAGDSAGTWYKIAPPAGEFRWLHEKYVGDGGRGTGGGGRDEGLGIRDRGSEQNPIPSSRWPTPERQSPIPGPQSPIPDGSPAHPAASALQLPAGSVRQVSPEAFQAELDDMNTELSIMLAEEPTVWSCDEMRHRAESLLAQAETALERGRARVLVNRLAQADDIKRRFADVEALKTDTDRRNRQLADAGRIRSEVRGPAPSAGRPGTDGRFDGAGRLARVTPSKVGAPRYALLDASGDILCYVSPAPGVNMQYYVGREVGVSGQQGYIADGGATHIMAKHVTALDSQLR